VSDDRPSGPRAEGGTGAEGGAVHPVVQYPDPVLRAECAEVTAFDGALRTLVADMFASMYAAEGVGLAANQIGRTEQVFVYDCNDADGVRHRGVVVNPVLELPEPGDRVLDEDLEGCLSVLGEHAGVARPDRAVVRGVDVDGQPVEVVGTGLLARCLQHETDHLAGHLYIDRLSARARREVLAGHAERLRQLGPPRS
jgi:peptide deformylase